jgi:hypothetical protein
VESPASPGAASLERDRVVAGEPCRAGLLGNVAAPGDGRTRVSGRCRAYRGERSPTGLMATTEAEARGQPAREPRKGGSEPSTVGTRTGSEAESRGRAGGYKRSPTVIDGDGRARRREGKGSALTRRDPAAERRQEVSRGHSSDEARRKPGGAKGRRTKEQSSMRS